MWIWIALACAVLTASADAVAKQLLLKSDERLVGWAKVCLTLPWVFPFFLTVGVGHLGRTFWMLMVLMIPLEITAYLCYLRAIRISPLSLAIPFLALTPLFTVATGWLFLGEKVTPLGFWGVAAVTVGAYLLQVEEARRGLLEPFKAMAKDEGIRLMLCAAALYSITATLGKWAIALSGPSAFPFLYLALDALALTEVARRGVGGMRRLLPEVRSQFRWYLLAGIVSAGAILTHSAGVLKVPVAYFLSIKRLSLLISVLYGGLLFGEHAFRQRIAGSSLMLTGAVLIILTV